MNAEPDGEIVREPDGERKVVDAVKRRPLRLGYPERLKPGPALLLARDTLHPRSEAVRSLRTKLLLARDGSPESGTLAVLSPCVGDGRSQLCAELAIAFAQLRRATLLVDADLRAPWQQVLFDGHGLPGLVHALRNEEPRVLGVQGIPDLAIVTSGGCPANPLELLSGDRFEQLMRAWQREFEFIIVDTPPITQYTDGLAIASAVHRALIVTRAPATSFADLKEMTRQLAAAPLRLVGAVINRF